MNAQVFSLNQTAISNALRSHAAFYPQRVSDALFEAYSTRLATYPLAIVEIALEQMSENAGRVFPTIQEIKSICDLYIGEKKQGDKSAYDKDVDDELKQYSEIKNFIEANIPKEAVDKYFAYYTKEMFGPMASELKNYGLNLEMFRRCAYFDLYEAKLKIPEAIRIMHEREKQNTEERKKTDFKPKKRTIHSWK